VLGDPFFWYGCLGGVVAEFMAAASVRRLDKKDRPRWVTSRFYWAWAPGFVALGGVIAWLYSSTHGVSINPLLAANIGATAPLIVEQWTRAGLPEKFPGTSD
jgi:hypothetical protein